MKRTDKHWLSHFVYSPIVSGFIILIFGAPMLGSFNSKYALIMVGLAVLMFLIAFFNYNTYRKEEEKERKKRYEIEERERALRASEEDRKNAVIRQQQEEIERLKRKVREQEEQDGK